MLMRLAVIVIALAHVAAYAASARVRGVLPLGFVGAWVAASLGLVALALVQGLAQARARRAYLAYEAGVALPPSSLAWPIGAATLSALRDAAVDPAGERTAELELELAGGDDAAPARVVHRQAVPRAAAPRLVPGARLVVRRNPADATQVAIDWEQSFPLEFARAPMPLA